MESWGITGYKLSVGQEGGVGLWWQKASLTGLLGALVLFCMCPDTPEFCHSWVRVTSTVEL